MILYPVQLSLETIKAVQVKTETSGDLLMHLYHRVYCVLTSVVFPHIMSSAFCFRVKEVLLVLPVLLVPVVFL